VIALCQANDIPVYQKNFSLAEAYAAEEAFVTGTFAGLAPVREIDGRELGTGKRGPVVKRLQSLYSALLEKECA
jgi:branched-chain amino acid aminotransferase